MRWFKRGYVGYRLISSASIGCSEWPKKFFSQAEHELLMKAKFMPNF